jgi:hypothetical protein
MGEDKMKTTIKAETEKVIDAVKNNKRLYVICPKCGRGAMQEGGRMLKKWECGWRDCGFATDEIPTTQEIKRLIELKAMLKKLKDWKI